MPSVPVGAQAIGQVRLLRRQLAGAAKQLRRRADSISDAVVRGAAFKSGTGSTRSWSRVFAAMPPPTHFDQKGRVAIWRTLQPVGPSLSLGGVPAGDDCVLVCGLVVGRGRGEGVRCSEVWGLGFNNHGLCRLLERSGFKADPIHVMEQSHDLLMGASAELAAPLLSEGQWCIPGGDGAWLASYRTTADGLDRLSVLTCETWIDSQSMGRQQRAQAAAIRHRQPGPTLGGGLLLPAILRPEMLGGA